MSAIAPISQLPSTNSLTWRIVIERSGTHRLYLMRTHAGLPISVITDRILAVYLQEQPWWSRRLCQPVMEIATMVGSVDSEAYTRNGLGVLVARSSPLSLAQANHHMFVVGSGASLGTVGPLRAILLRPKLSCIGLGVVTLTVLLAIVAPGVILGVAAGQAEMGITLSAAIAGTFALAGNLREQPGYR